MKVKIIIFFITFAICLITFSNISKLKVEKYLFDNENGDIKSNNKDNNDINLVTEKKMNKKKGINFKKIMNLMDNKYMDKKKIIIVYPKCRLGNLMFIFASGLGLSHKTNVPLRINHNFWNKYTCFNIPNGFIQRKLPPNFPIKEKFERTYSDHFINGIKSTNKSVWANGYLQSWKYFDDIIDDVREFFKSNFNTNGEGKKFVNQYRNIGFVPIGVHIRMGDIKNYNGFRKPNKKYFDTAMNILKKTIYPKKPIFILLSDDIPEVKKIFKSQLESKEAILIPS